MKISVEYAGREIILEIDEKPREYGQFLVALSLDGKERLSTWFTDKSEER